MTGASSVRQATVPESTAPATLHAAANPPTLDASEEADPDSKAEPFAYDHIASAEGEEAILAPSNGTPVTSIRRSRSAQRTLPPEVGDMILEAALASAGHRLDKLLFKDGRASWLWHQGRQVSRACKEAIERTARVTWLTYIIIELASTWKDEGLCLFEEVEECSSFEAHLWPDMTVGGDLPASHSSPRSTSSPSSSVSSRAPSARAASP